MDFLNPGQKIKKYRKQLRMSQLDFQDKNMTRSYLGMLETGKRKLNSEIAELILEKMKKKALECGIEFNIDSSRLMMSEKDEAREYCLNKLQQTLTEGEFLEIIKIAQQYMLLEIEAKAYRIIADQYYENSNYKKAFINYNLSLDISKSIPLNCKQPYLYNRLGMCKYMELAYSEALLYFSRANHYSIIYNDIKTELNSIYNLALSCESAKMLDDAIKYIELYLSMVNKVDNADSYIYGEILKANCLEEQGEVNDAINLYLNLINITNNNVILGNLYNNLGYLNYKISNFEKSITFFNKSQEIRMKYDEVHLSHTLIHKSELYIKNKLFNEAIMLLSLGIDYAKKFNDKEYLVKGYSLLSDIYLYKTDYDSVEENYLKALEIIKEDHEKNQLLKIYLKLIDLYTIKNNSTNIRKYIELSQNIIDSCCLDCI